jgi:hypothetical protein
MGSMTLMDVVENFQAKFTRSTAQIAPQSGHARRSMWAMIAAVALAGCGLEARPIESVRRADTADRAASAQTSSDPTTQSMAIAASGQGFAVDTLDPDMLRAISRRAVHDMTTTHRGFLPSIVAVSACYESLQGDDALEARLFCLQLDTAAWFVESSAPPAWQEMDAASNDYFTDERFFERRWREVPPFADTREARLQKQALLDALDAAAGAAIREYVETIAQGAFEEAAPAPTSSQPSKPTP